MGSIGAIVFCLGDTYVKAIFPACLKVQLKRTCHKVIVLSQEIIQSSSLFFMRKMYLQGKKTKNKNYLRENFVNSLWKNLQVKFLNAKNMEHVIWTSMCSLVLWTDFCIFVDILSLCICFFPHGWFFSLGREYVYHFPVVFRALNWGKQVFSHPSTYQAWPCLALEILRQRAHSGWYGYRQGKQVF